MCPGPPIQLFLSAALFRRPWFCCVKRRRPGLGVIEPCLPSAARAPPSLLTSRARSLANSASLIDFAFFYPIELLDFICNAETNHAPELITRLLSLLHIALRHASSLKDQIREDGKV